MSAKHVIAVDLGAGSGRVMDIAFDGERFIQTELHRFKSPPVQVRGSFYWDVLGIWREIQDGLAQRHPDTASIGVDTWGVDFALVDKHGELLANPRYYRDSLRVSGYEWLMENFSRRAIFDHTGIQFMPINSLYQLVAWHINESPLLKAANTLLTMPDLFHYWLTGEKLNEFTIATTTQMFNPSLGDWDRGLLAEMGIPNHFFAPVVRAGERIGAWEGVPVIVPPTHDTASAVVAVPTTTADYAYLSSGTWSLLGLEVKQAFINDMTYAANLTNEGGYNHTYRLLKNIMGLWIIEQTLETWRNERGVNYTYEECMAMVAAADDPFRSFVDPDDGRFLPPGDMPVRVQDYCREHNQPVPESDAQMLTALYVSLAFKYRYALDALQAVSGQAIQQLHIIGGGSQNRVLNQMTANAIGRPVYAGPTEATALGNAVVQMIALGELGSLSQAREALRTSVGLTTYTPQATDTWQSHYERYRALMD
jgi:rhamnulokinase